MAHVIVVEDDDQPVLVGAGIVHGFIGHAGGHRAVADHGDDIVLAAGEVARHRHAERGGNRGRGVGGAERIVIAFGPLGEAGQAAAGAQRADAVPAAGQDLVRIGLVADVPDQAVARGVEDVMDGRGQFDDAEAGAEMPAGDGNRVDGLLPQFIGDLPDLVNPELAQIVGGPDRVEKRRFTKIRSRRDSNFACRGQAARREMGCAVSAAKNPDAERHLSRPKPDL